MEKKELTEEQKKKIAKLQQKFMLATGLVGAKAGLLMFLANAIVVGVDVMYVHNQSFVIFMAIVNAFMVFRSMRSDMMECEEKAREELKKILEPNS